MYSINLNSFTLLASIQSDDQLKNTMQANTTQNNWKKIKINDPAYITLHDWDNDPGWAGNPNEP